VPLLALSNGQRLGLALVAAVFILFSLLCALVIPRARPDFPGTNGLRAFVAVTIVLLIAMLGAVEVFARESHEEPAEEGAAETITAEEETTTATTGTTTTAQGTTTAAAAEGNAEAGKSVFASAGCGGCHTLEAAGSTGTVGPSLDESKPDFDLVVERVTNGQGVMPSFKDRLSEQQIKDVAAYVVESTQG
jgi:cytochrome c6